MIEKITLPNGLNLLTKQVEANDIVAINLSGHGGSRYETDEQAGWSDMTLRLFMKGTKNFSSMELAEAIDSSGIRLSSHAGRNSASVSLLATKDSMDKALDLFFEVLLNPTFPEDKVSQEKEMQIRRIAATEDQLLSKAMELLTEHHFGLHPYHKPHLGYEESIKNFSTEEAKKIHETIIAPNNMVVSIVGNFQSEYIISRFSDVLGILPSKARPPFKEPPIPERSKPAIIKKERESEAAWITIGFDAPSMTHSDFAAMEVLDSITGGSMDSRLFAELRDKQGLAYQVSSSYIARQGPSIYMAYIGTRPENYDRAHQGILKELEKVATEVAPMDEVERAKTYLQGLFMMGQESNGSQAGLFSHYELMGLGHGFVDEYPKLIANIQPEDVKKVAETYLTRPYTLGSIIPKNKN